MVEISVAVRELSGDELHLRIARLLKSIVNCIEQLEKKKKTKTTQKNPSVLPKTLQGHLVHLPTPESINTM